MAGNAPNLGPGARLDRYEIESLLARGGMGEVWIAKQRGELGFERRVALKTLHPALEDETEARAMMMDEARIVSRIKHDNVVKTLDVGREGDVLFIVMELVDGTTLAKLHAAARKNGARVPLATTLQIVSDALAGLHAAHELRDDHGALLNVVHRDVSLENILVTDAGRAKLIDFGVAKAKGRMAARTTGVAKGKVKYMPPEQAKSQDVDRRADVWAMGAVLRILITDEAPFPGETDVETLYMIANGQDPKPLPPEVTGSLRAVIERALSLKPHDRFATAEEMRVAIDRVRSESDELVTPLLPTLHSAPSLDRYAETLALPTRAIAPAAWAPTTTPALLPTATTSFGAMVTRRWRATTFALLGATIVVAGVFWIRGAREQDRERGVESAKEPASDMITEAPRASGAPPVAQTITPGAASASPAISLQSASAPLTLAPAMSSRSFSARPERSHARVSPLPAQSSSSPIHDYGF